MKAGLKVPKFQLSDQGGGPRTFDNLCGPRGLVLYVYPRDNTSGCSTEAAEFQEFLDDFAALGFKVAGLGKDSAVSHQKFAAKLTLSFPLLSDPSTALIQDLGAWGVKKLYGKEVEGVMRSTFVFDAGGKLIKSYAKVKAQGHAQQVLDDLKAA